MLRYRASHLRAAQATDRAGKDGQAKENTLMSHDRYYAWPTCACNEAGWQQRGAPVVLQVERLAVQSSCGELIRLQAFICNYVYAIP